MATKKCKHDNVTASDEIRGFSGPVYREPYTHENRAAHGGITYTQVCDDCGSERSVLQNQRFLEFGPWGPDLATRERRERERLEREQQEREAAEDAALVVAKIRVLERRDGQICVEKNGRRQWISEWEASRACQQTDTGDGLVQCYRAILRQSRELGFNRV